MIEVGAPYFYPKRRDDYWAVMEAAYARAKQEAQRILASKRIETKIELLKPVHLNRSLYNLPGSTNTDYTLKSNVALFPWGVLNTDPTWTALKWYEGAGTKYIADWFVRPVYFFEEKEGAYAGNLDAYAFRGDESFRINCVSTTSSVLIEGWLLAFAVMPVTLEEVKIIV